MCQGKTHSAMMFISIIYRNCSRINSAVTWGGNDKTLKFLLGLCICVRCTRHFSTAVTDKVQFLLKARSCWRSCSYVFQRLVKWPVKIWWNMSHIRHGKKMTGLAFWNRLASAQEWKYVGCYDFLFLGLIVIKKECVYYPHSSKHRWKVTWYWIDAKTPDRLCRCESCKWLGDPSFVLLLFTSGLNIVLINSEPKTQNI